MSRRTLPGLLSVALVALVGASSVGCVVHTHDDSPPVVAATTIEFGEVLNLGYMCGGGADFSWKVTARETHDTGTAGCQQPVDFVGYEPGVTYTFDVVGYDGTRVCWQGSCTVTAENADKTYADCGSQIDHLCGL